MRVDRPRVAPEIRFMAKVKKTDYCWLWLGAPADDGYGQFDNGIKTVGSHQFAYTYFIGKIPRNKHVLHKCDNRLCVNPAHLELGNPLKNARDMWKRGRGRHMFGTSNGMYGKIPWNKGKTWSTEIRAKISKANQGKIPWNLGLHIRPGWPPKDKNHAR